MTTELHLGDCLEVMAALPDSSVDAVITDPPYGTTACKWDSVIPFEPMWQELKRIAKPKAAIALFGSQPFTSMLVGSNLSGFKYQWVWHKKRPTGFANAKKRPLKITEDISVFNGNSYIPQGLIPCGKEMRNSRSTGGDTTRKFNYRGTYTQEFTNYPHNVLHFSLDEAAKIHPTQKPVDLLRYLVRTYTQTGETVLDFTMGSGTTGVACVLENRNFIGIEKDKGYYEIAQKRIEDAKQQHPLLQAA